MDGLADVHPVDDRSESLDGVCCLWVHVASNFGEAEFTESKDVVSDLCG